MPAGSYDIVVEQGALFEMIVLVESAVDTPIDLTGYAFEGQIRKSISDSSIIAPFEYELLDQSGVDMGKVRLFISSDVTAEISIKNKVQGDRSLVDYLYDISYGPTGGEKYRLLQGTASISPEVTR